MRFKDVDQIWNRVIAQIPCLTHDLDSTFNLSQISDSVWQSVNRRKWNDRWRREQVFQLNPTLNLIDHFVFNGIQALFGQRAAFAVLNAIERHRFRTEEIFSAHVEGAGELEQRRRRGCGLLILIFLDRSVGQADLRTQVTQRQSSRLSSSVQPLTDHGSLS